jgi:site-specific recombinase XerD
MADSLSDLHDQFLAEQRFASRRAEATLRGYRQCFGTLTALLPNLTLAGLTSSVMTEFFRRLDTRTRFVGRGLERTGVKASTVATYRSKLGRFFRWLQTNGHLATNPFAAIPGPRVEYEERQHLDRSAVERIFANLILDGSRQSRLLRRRNLAIFALLLFTGIRRGELLGLRVADVNLERNELMVRAETSKSRRTRVVPLNSKASRTLIDYFAELRQARVRNEYLFPSDSQSGALTRDGLKHLVAQVSRQSGVRFHVHQFRHTFAVNFLNRGGDVARLKQLLGHRDIRMTSGYLRHLPTHAMRDAIEGVTLDSLL